MSNEEIERFMQTKHKENFPVRITFKTRAPIRGLFIKTNDYAELSRKNLWRIVSESNINNYQSSKDDSLARIFNGVEITKLEVLKAE
jgi:hypothetical protein